MNMRPRLCYLHLGAPKTGTSAIQRYCVAHARELAKVGFCYPLANARGFGHHDIVFRMSGGYPDWALPQEKTLDELTSELIAEIQSRSAHLILSSENFYLLAQASSVMGWLRTVFASHAVSYRVIVYVRRQDDAHESWYNQTVKAQGYTHSLKECIATFSQLWDYQAILQPWIEVFGLENVIVRRYAPTINVVHDFLSALGVDVDQFSIPETHINPSLSADLVEFQRLVNQLPLPVVKKRAFHRRLTDLSIATRGTRLFSNDSLLSDAQRREIMDRYQQSNKWLGDTFFQGTSPFPPARATRRASAAGLTTEKLAMILGWVLCDTVDAETGVAR